MSELGHATAAVRADIAALEHKLRQDLDSSATWLSMEAVGGIENSHKAKFANMQTSLQEELQAMRSDVENQLNVVINRVHQRVAEDLAEERTQRCKELQEFKREVAALEEVHREVERGTQSQFQQEIQAAMKECSESFESIKEQHDANIKSSVDTVNSKLAYCVEQLQTFVEEDIAKQQKAMKKFRHEIDERTTKETKMTADLFEKLHSDLEARVLKPVRAAETAITEIKSKLTAEERSRLLALKEVCNEIEALSGRCAALEENKNLEEMTAMEEVAVKQDKLIHEVQMELDSRFAREERDRKQVLIQLSSGIQTELCSALEESEARMQDVIQDKLVADNEKRAEELNKLKREQRQQLLDMMEKLSAVVEEEAEESSARNRALAIANTHRDTPEGYRARDTSTLGSTRRDPVTSMQNRDLADSGSSRRMNRSAAYASGYAAGYSWND